MRKAHGEALENGVKCLETLNLKVKGEKSHFLQNEIKFYELIFSVEGTMPDPERTANLIKVPSRKAQEQLEVSLEWRINATSTFLTTQQSRHR